MTVRGTRNGTYPGQNAGDIALFGPNQGDCSLSGNLANSLEGFTITNNYGSTLAFNGAMATVSGSTGFTDNIKSTGKFQLNNGILTLTGSNNTWSSGGITGVGGTVNVTGGTLNITTTASELTANLNVSGSGSKVIDTDLANIAVDGTTNNGITIGNAGFLYLATSPPTGADMSGGFTAPNNNHVLTVNMGGELVRGSSNATAVTGQVLVQLPVVVNGGGLEIQNYNTNTLHLTGSTTVGTAAYSLESVPKALSGLFWAMSLKAEALAA